MLGAAAIVGKLTRAAVLAGNLCTGEEVDPMPPDCLRVFGRAECALPGDLKIQADAVFVDWREGSHAIHLMAKGKATIHRGKETFSADDARLVIDAAETNPRLRDVEFVFRPGGFGNRCE